MFNINFLLMNEYLKNWTVLELKSSIYDNMNDDTMQIAIAKDSNLKFRMHDHFKIVVLTINVGWYRLSQEHEEFSKKYKNFFKLQKYMYKKNCFFFYQDVDVCWYVSIKYYLSFYLLGKKYLCKVMPDKSDTKSFNDVFSRERERTKKLKFVYF